MTYSEIHDFIWGQREPRPVTELPAEDRLPWLVLEFFQERKGFDWWWGDIDMETQDEIFDELRATLLAWRQPEEL